jgi:predicted nucleic acid-binding Zn ribbon protein
MAAYSYICLRCSNKEIHVHETTVDPIITCKKCKGAMVRTLKKGRK